MAFLVAVLLAMLLLIFYEKWRSYFWHCVVGVLVLLIIGIAIFVIQSTKTPTISTTVTPATTTPQIFGDLTNYWWLLVFMIIAVGIGDFFPKWKIVTITVIIFLLLSAIFHFTNHHWGWWKLGGVSIGSPRALAVFFAILLLGLLVVGLCTGKISFVQLLVGIAVVGIGLVIAWNYYAPPSPRLTLNEEKGCEQKIVRGPKFEIGDFIIPRVVEGGTAYWADGHKVKAGTGRPALDSPPLRFCATDPNMVITYEVMKP